MRKNLMLLTCMLAFLCVWGECVFAQNPSAAKRINYGPALAATCDATSGEVFIKTGVSPTEFYYCSNANTWSRLADAGALASHLADTANPHGVTKAQVGLSNVTNDAQLKAAANLSDVANAATARTSLGLGTAATLNVPASGNAASGEVVKGSDTRLTDTRTPTSHTHAEAEVTNLVTDLAAKQSLDADLTALSALPATAGLLARTAADTFAARTLTGTAGRVVVTNGTGAAGDPTLDIGTDVVTLTGAQTLTGKTLTTPTIGSFANAAHTHQNAAGGGTLDAAAVASGTMATARLGSGTASSSTYLRGDQTYATPVTSVAGTANQVTASASTGAVTLSLPQSIATTSTPQFAGMTISGSAGSATDTGPTTLAVTNTSSLSYGHAVKFENSNSGNSDIVTTYKSNYGTGTVPSFGGLKFYRTASGVGNGNAFHMSLQNSASAEKEYGGFAIGIESNTAGAEKGYISLQATSGGTTRQEKARVTSAGSLVVGGTSGAALATTATEGFLYIPTTAGTPTGVPTAYTGRVPMVYNTVANQLCVYSAAAWRCF